MERMNVSDPWVLDIRSLQRRPGSMIEVSRTLPAPSDLAVAMARVPEGADVDLELRLESVMDGVLVTGTAEAEVVAECSRCLDPMSWHESFELSELFVYPTTDARGAIVDVPTDEEDPLPEVLNDTVDLGPVVRDAVVLELPLTPVCDASCAGLCPTCGERLDNGHQHPSVDPRWSALETLLTEQPD